MNCTRLNDEQNLAFVNNPERLAAEKEMRDTVKLIQTSVKSDCANAGYYLTVLPMYLKRLENAVENLNKVEAKVQAQILGII